VDWNNDGKKDLLVGEQAGYLRIYLNTGTDASPVFSGYSLVKVGGVNWKNANGFTKPEVVDWNNDGLFDIVCGDGGGGVWLLRNQGTAGSPLFNTATFLYNGSYALVGSSRASPVVVDWNRDGKKDLILGGYDGTLRFYDNKGTDAQPSFNGYTTLNAGGSPIHVGNYSRPEVVDWDDDGWPDLLVGNYEGMITYYHTFSGPFVNSMTPRDGNMNGYFERGEICSLTVVLTNASDVVTGLVASLSTTSRWCAVTVSNWSIGTHAPGTTRTNASQPFQYVLATNIPHGCVVPFSLDLVGNGGVYQLKQAFSIQVAEPVFSIAQVLVNDASGNGDGACNPGETVQLLVKLKDSGLRAGSVTAQLGRPGRPVLMINSNASFGTMESGAQAVNWQTPFAFTIPASAPTNACYSFNLAVSFLDGSQPTNLPVILGNYSVTSNTPFSWINMSSATTVPLGDEDIVSVPLGFNFPFYTLTTNALYIDSNGYLMSGPPLSSFSINTIPNTNPPNCIIAPNWEDLDPGSGGIIRYASFGSSPNRYWVAEWTNVPLYYYTNSIRSFQVILHENGTIKFQFGASSGSVYSRSVGLENNDGTLGRAWTGRVANGVALLFSLAPGVVDSDADSLPDGWEQFYFGSLTNKATDDPDHDGVSNLAEYRGGTDPTRVSSLLRINQAGPVSSSQMGLQWQGIPGKTYFIWTSTNMPPSGWSLLTSSGITGAVSGINSYTNTFSPSSKPRYFRISTP
jgi:hypothetical protein